MSGTLIWAGVGVAMQSVLGAAIPMTAVTKANPGVATATGHGLSNGDFVLLKEVQGMLHINNRVFRVAASSANNFTLEAEDTTLYDTFVSGNAYKVTLGTSFSTLLDFNPSGGEWETEDDTTIHQKQRTSVNTVASAVEISTTSRFDVSDPALLAAKKASDLGAERVLMITFSNGQKWLINAGVGCSMSPTGSAQGKVTTALKFVGRGPATLYSS